MFELAIMNLDVPSTRSSSRLAGIYTTNTSTRWAARVEEGVAESPIILTELVSTEDVYC